MPPGEPSLDAILGLDLEWAERILSGKYSARRRRPPHPPLAMIRALIFQRMKQIPSWRKLALTIRSEPALLPKLGFLRAPCHDSFSEFTIRIGPGAVEEIFRGMVDRIRAAVPGLGFVTAIDSTVVRGYTRPRKRGVAKTDPDAAWGVSGQKLGRPIYAYGYKVQVACDAMLDLPLSFKVAPANHNDSRLFPEHLRLLIAQGERPDVIAADAGYDSKRNNLLCLKHRIRPVIALNPRRSKNRHHRRADYLLPISRRSQEWDYFYSMRSSIERVFSRLKEELGLLDLKLRKIGRVSVHFAFCLVAILAVALASFANSKPELALSVEAWRYWSK